MRRFYRMHLEKEKLISWTRKLGPGLITGAADDDPSGIATYSQAGSQFGFNLLWTILFTYPLMVSIQVISAKIGRVTGEGLAATIRKHYPAWILYSVISLLLVANTFNIAADISAMGEATKLITGGSAQLYAVCFGMDSLFLQVFVPYQRYVRILKWLTLSLLAYFATAFVVHVPWSEVLIETVLPHISLKSDYITTMVAVFGTTISPYLFFWQASQEVEDLRVDPAGKSLLEAPEEASSSFNRIKIDTYFGMGFSNLVSFFIILTAGLTLHLHGITDIQTSAQAATALRPIAGNFAFLIFSLGIIGTGMLAVPVLAGSAAYAVSEAFSWQTGLSLKPKQGIRFYGIVATATLIGVILGFTSIDPIKALYWSAVLNGIISVPIMVLMMLMASRTQIMGQFVISKRLNVLGWLAVLFMGLAVGDLFYSFFD